MGGLHLSLWKPNIEKEILSCVLNGLVLNRLSYVLFPLCFILLNGLAKLEPHRRHSSCLSMLLRPAELFRFSALLAQSESPQQFVMPQLQSVLVISWSFTIAGQLPETNSRELKGEEKAKIICLSWEEG